MSGHLSNELLEQYSARKLAAAALIEADDHLAACAECFERLENIAAGGLAEDFSFSLKEFDAVGRETEPHLDFDSQLMPYVDQTLARREKSRVDEHLRHCALCRSEVADLQAFRAKLEKAERAAAPVVEEPGALARLQAFWARRLPQFALAATLLAIVALTVVWSSFRSTDQNLVLDRPVEENRALSTFSPAALDEPENRSSNLAERSPDLASNDKNGRELIAAETNRKRNSSDPNATKNPSGFRRETAAEPENDRVNFGKPDSLKDLSGNDVRFLAPDQTENLFTVTAPLATNVRSLTPVFEWQSLAGAESYTVTVTDANFNRVLKSQPVSGNRWESTAALKRGQIYYWQVTALKNGTEITAPLAPQPEAKFRILSDAEETKLAQTMQKTADSHLARAVVFARAGLLDEAEEELEKQIETKQKTDAARKLLQNVRSWRR